MNGFTEYEGKPCSRCFEKMGVAFATSRRYVSNGACIECARVSRLKPGQTLADVNSLNEAERVERSAIIVARKIAVENGERTYDGGTCKKCGTTKRYTANAACVQCARGASRDLAKRITAAKNADHPQPFRFDTPPTCEHAAIYAQMPYLNGNGVTYAACSKTDHLMDKVRRIGQCVLCHPNQLITINNAANMRQLPGLDQYTTSILADLCANDQISGVPGRSVASLCLRDEQMRKHEASGSEYVPPTFHRKPDPVVGLPLPGLPLPTGGQPDE